MHAQKLYERFIEITSKPERALAWNELPPLVREAWGSVFLMAASWLPQSCKWCREAHYKQLHEELIKKFGN